MAYANIAACAAVTLQDIQRAFARQRNRPGSNPEREDEGGYVEEER